MRTLDHRASIQDAIRPLRPTHVCHPRSRPTGCKPTIASIEASEGAITDFSVDFTTNCRARAAGTELAVPRVADLLADPAFHPLEQWLLQRQVNVDDLQAAVDQFLTQAKQMAGE